MPEPESIEKSGTKGEPLPGGLPKDLYDILVCPACLQSLELKPEGDRLKCVACHRVYPVTDGVPRMLVDIAVVED